jgi:exopolysaccharide biosynthesis polyprenyl glycosylphosphotransferase
MNASNSSSSAADPLPREIETAMDSIPFNYELETAAPGRRLEDLRPASRAGRRSHFLQRLLLSADIVAGLLGGAVTALIFSLSPLTGLGLMLALVVVYVFLAFALGLYTDRDLLTWTSGLSDAPRAITAALMLSWPIFGIVVALGADPAVAIALTATILTTAADGIVRALARGWAHTVAPLRQRTLLVGSGMVAERLADRLDRHVEFGLETIGLVDNDVHNPDGAERLRKLGSLGQLDSVLDECSVDRVIIAFSRASHQQLLSCIRTCRDHRVAVDIVPRLFELIDGGPALSQIGGLPLISISQPRLTPLSRAAKRALDIVVSGALLVLLSPLLVLVALAIKLDSRGPVLFRQVRAGRGGEEFRVFKFRSMYRDAEERKRQMERNNEATDGVMFKIKRDPRITRVGRLIRRTSIDELPQLINVLTGDMSLVGPRPLILDESKHAAQSWHARRLDLRPGITGPWQVSGRSDLPFQDMVRFDYQYVSGWSLARDFEILLATIPVVLSGRGAY